MRTFLDSVRDTLGKARHVVVFTGAGMSAESGIPTFRDALTGLWSQYEAERLATPEAFRRDPALVWGWYEWRRLRALQAQPHEGHVALAAIERHVGRMTLITQNVDDLHERAGSREVLHLHGSLHAPRCSRCGQAHALSTVWPGEPEGGRRLAPPACVACAAPVRPGVVWFGESLPADVLQRAAAAADDCDLWITVGTSGLVYPAAELPQRAARAGAQLVQINPQATPLDDWYAHRLRSSAATVLPQIAALLHEPG